VGSKDVSVIATTPYATSNPSEGIQKLIDIIKDLYKNSSDNAISVDSLDNVIKLLDDNDPNNDKSVCDILDLFIPKESANEGSGQQLTEEQATVIQNTLKC
jgi:hypothetical protein